MTIRKGEEWGSSVERPKHLAVARSDRELAALVADNPNQAVGVSGGDLFLSVGAPRERDPLFRLAMDLLQIEADGVQHFAVAHVVARRSWWRGRIVEAMNVDHLGEWKAAPRAHPNDGRFDIVEVDPAMTMRQRLQAHGRLVQGTHVPHPRINTSTSTRATWHFDRPHRLWIDGEPVGSVHEMTVSILPDAFAVHV